MTDWYDDQWALKNQQDQIVGVSVADKANWNSKAPSGYGLGVPLSGVPIADANLAITTGMYYANMSDPNRPTGVTDGSLFVTAYSSVWVNQMYLDWRTNKTYRRMCTNGVWSAWVELARVVSTTDPSPWIALTLTSPWVNFGYGFENAGYYKDSMGIVHLKGLIAGGTNGSTISTLPAGCIPLSLTKIFPLFVTEVMGRLDITNAGTLIFRSTTASTYVSLDGISFRADA